ncbi:hypothetical protein BDZ45DRAFT_807743 [Acephala macrosclerotiorum]|nr:hypothetical protein BDZ45DRAFT_807743 [Acephala macrosclerotiorum]
MPSPTSSSTAGEANSCPGISITYSCGHTWLEHARECVIGTTSRCPPVTAESSRPEFACLTCGPPGSDNPSKETILKARSLSPEFGYWVNSLIKSKNDALHEVEANKVEISNLRKEATDLRTAVEKLKKSEAESKKIVKALEKQQVKNLVPFSGKMAPPPLPVKSPAQVQVPAGPSQRKTSSKGQGQGSMVTAPKNVASNVQAQGLAVQAPTKKAQAPEGPSVPIPAKPTSNNQVHGFRKWSFGRLEGTPSDFDDVEVLQQYEDCDHSERVFFAKQGKPDPVVAKAIITEKKAGICGKCIKVVKSSGEEKVQVLQKELGTNFEKMIDDFYDTPQRPQLLKRTSSGKAKTAHNTVQPRGSGGRFVKAASVTEPLSPTLKLNEVTAPLPSTPQSKSKAIPQSDTPMSASMIVYEPTESQLKAKEIVDMFFATPFQEIFDDLKARQKTMVDTNYGIFVLDNLAEMELALRKGDERKFLVKKNELLRNRKDIERDLNESADIFGEDILKETQDCLQKNIWLAMEFVETRLVYLLK